MHLNKLISKKWQAFQRIKYNQPKIPDFYLIVCYQYNIWEHLSQVSPYLGALPVAAARDFIFVFWQTKNT
jgi:hypothetical protein